MGFRSHLAGKIAYSARPHPDNDDGKYLISKSACRGVRAYARKGPYAVRADLRCFIRLLYPDISCVVTEKAEESPGATRTAVLRRYIRPFTESRYPPRRVTRYTEARGAMYSQDYRDSSLLTSGYLRWVKMSIAFALLGGSWAKSHYPINNGCFRVT